MNSDNGQENKGNESLENVPFIGPLPRPEPDAAEIEARSCLDAILRGIVPIIVPYDEDDTDEMDDDDDATDEIDFDEADETDTDDFQDESGEMIFGVIFPYRRSVPVPEEAPDEPSVVIRADCAICHEKMVATITYPCLHAAMCVGCARDYGQVQNVCPVCRTPLQSIERMYLSFTRYNPNPRPPPPPLPRPPKRRKLTLPDPSEHAVSSSSAVSVSSSTSSS